MRRLAVIGVVSVLALASCSDGESTEPPPETCAEPPCEDTCASPPCDDTCEDPPCDDTCENPPCDEPAPLAFVHVPIVIDDPIVNGTSLMLPVDGISYGYAGSELVTAFGRDFDDPTQTFLWHLDETTGTHSKKSLSGAAFSQTENLCVDEDWCQFIGYHDGAWVIAGPAAGQMMRVDASFTSSLTAVSGPRPPASHIDHSHRFAAGELFLFGATGPSSFSDTVSVLSLSSGTWQQPVSGLPQTDSNCLAFDSTTRTLYSLAGRTTSDGGNTTRTEATITAIDVDGGSFTTNVLPTEIGGRRGMSCAFDSQRGILFAFGGAVVNDNFNDALNTFFNDLWAYDVAADSWTLLVAGTAGGMLGDPDMYGDQRFEGDSTGPNFGRNRGHMQLDAGADRLMLIGAVPVFTHEQLYVLSLEGL